MLFRQFLRCKIHRATVTESNLNYEGSITISKELLDASSIDEFEKVDIYNITNGERFSTYVIADQENSGRICINGAGARLVQVGDKIIICSYYLSNETFFGTPVQPLIVYVDDNNKVVEDE